MSRIVAHTLGKDAAERLAKEIVAACSDLRGYRRRLAVRRAKKVILVYVSVNFVKRNKALR